MRFRAVSVDVTPTTSLELGGYAGPARWSSSVTSRLEASIALWTEGKTITGIVSIDTLFVGSELIAMIERRLPNNTSLMFCASHTHFAPSVDASKPKLGKVDRTYIEKVATKIADAIINQLEVQGNLARADYSTIVCSENIYRRRRATRALRRWPFIAVEVVAVPNPAEVPNHIQIISISDESGAPLTVIWSWPCHAVDGISLTSVNACFPGVVRKALREFFQRPDLPVVYFPGFSGDLRPKSAIRKPTIGSFIRHPFMLIPWFGPFTDNDMDFADRVAANALGALKERRPIKLATPVNCRKTIDLREISENSGVIEIAVLKVGELEIVGVGAEVCSPYSTALDHRVDQPLILSGCVGPTFGYIASAKQLDEGGYEAIGFLQPFSLSSPLSTNAEEVFLERVRAAISEVRETS